MVTCGGRALVALMCVLFGRIVNWSGLSDGSGLSDEAR